MDGILLVDKPSGWTSHDAVAKIRNSIKAAESEKLPRVSHLSEMQGSGEQRGRRTNRYGERAAQVIDAAECQEARRAAGPASRQVVPARKIRVGHAGTLDPMATGLLIVLVGKATKQQDSFMKLDKVYQAEVTLGATSTTDDAEGMISNKKKVISKKLPNTDDIKEILKKFTGEIEQVPPQFSAIKVGGKRAYKTARAGGVTELKARQVTIYGFENIEYEYPVIKFTVRVSSGTYIRSLARDIGEALDTGAYLSGLRRTKIGGFGVEDAISPEVSSDDLVKNISAVDKNKKV